MLHPERALENLITGSQGLVFSQSVLLALVDSGLSRDDAYRVVQAASRRAIEEGRNFREVVECDDEMKLSDDALSNAFDVDRLLTHRRRFIDALVWRS